jgi:hypothetical protein
MTTQHTQRKYNFNYDNSQLPSTEEYKIIRKLSSSMLYQDALVRKCLETEIFSYDDISNLVSVCEDCENCLADKKEYCDNVQDNEVYNWIAFDDSSDWTIQKLDKAGITYINNDYGLWIGRGDCGSAADLYFLPMLADALYNYEIDKSGNIIKL